MNEEEIQVVARLPDLMDADRASRIFQQRDLQQVHHAGVHISKPVAQLIAHIAVILLGLDLCDSAIDVDAGLLSMDIGLGDVSVDQQVDLYLGLCRDNPLALLYLFFQHGAEQLIPHRIHMPVLLRTQHVSGATDLQIAHRDLKAGTKLGKITQGDQTFLRHLAKHLVALIH